MDDLEMVKRCAEAMGLQFAVEDGLPTATPAQPHVERADPDEDSQFRYDPLHDDAQCLALVKRFRLSLDTHGSSYWCVNHTANDPVSAGTDKDLNRAIVECVARLKERA